MLQGVHVEDFWRSSGKMRQLGPIQDLLKMLLGMPGWKNV